LVTSNVYPCLEPSGETQGGRGLRRSVMAVGKKRRPCRRFIASPGDSLDEEVPEDEAQLLVSSAERGVVRDGGAPASCRRWLSVAEEKTRRKGGEDGGAREGMV
jgi:hypothetical protein